MDSDPWAHTDGSSLHDTLLRKIGMLRQRCVENERLIKRLKMELILSKSHARQTKCQIRIDYNWDGMEANYADSVWVCQGIFVSTFLVFEGQMDGIRQRTGQLFHICTGEGTDL
jgi:hypothetical protein